MKRSLLRFITIRSSLIGLLFVGALSRDAFADVVADWNATLETAMRNPTPSMPVQARTSAIVHVAMFDAVNGITRRYTPLHVTDAALPGARPEAAAVYAAYTTLVSLVPAKRAVFDEQLATSLAEIAGANANNASLAAGRAWGEMVAGEILAWRANDGFSDTMTYPGPTDIGYWRHAPLGGALAEGLTMSVTEPFALTYLGGFDMGPPYGMTVRAAALARSDYAADLNEMKVRGGAVSAFRTQEQTDRALFLNRCDVSDLNAMVRRLLSSSSRLDDSARAFALLNIAAADAAIVCYKDNYKYGFWRPFQAIAFADQDGNASTVADATWTPMGIVTPSHPESMSEYTTIFSSMLQVAEGLFGYDTHFTLSTSNPGAPMSSREFSSFPELADTMMDARIDIGFSFRAPSYIGAFVGSAIGYVIMENTIVPRRAAK